MRTSTPVILAAVLLMLLASACKRNQTNESAAIEEDHAAASTDDQAADKAEAEARDEAKAPTEAAETADRRAATDTEPAPSGRDIDAIPLPKDWVEVRAQTPKGIIVSFGVPSGWVELPPPNESTLVVRGAPYKIPAGGTQLSAVVMEFTGGRTEFADYTRQRLINFANIRRDGPLRIGTIDAHEFVADWSRSGGNKETMQLLVATGEEGIGVTCTLTSGQLEALGGLCDEIFATLSINHATPEKNAKP